jgi:hypothetical protein
MTFTENKSNKKKSPTAKHKIPHEKQRKLKIKYLTKIIFDNSLWA